MELKEKIQGFSLKDKTALIIGCGGLGCNISVHLAGSGIGRLILCDYDTVSLSNLNRQFLFTKEDIGKSKVLCVKEKLNLFAPECKIDAFDIQINNEDDFSVFPPCDIVFAAVDNNKTRQLLTDFCKNKNLPLVVGGIDGFYGIAYLQLPSCNEPPVTGESSAKAEFNISSTAGIIGSAQAALGIKYLLTGDEIIAKNILIYDQTEFNTLKKI